MTAGGLLQMGRTIPMVAPMLFCGFFAGWWGKRRTIGCSVFLMGLGMLLCSISPIYSILFLALMVAGIGEGVLEGLATPFIQDLHMVEPGRYINLSHHSGVWSLLTF